MNIKLFSLISLITLSSVPIFSMQDPTHSNLDKAAEFTEMFLHKLSLFLQTPYEEKTSLGDYTSIGDTIINHCLSESKGFIEISDILKFKIGEYIALCKNEEFKNIITNYLTSQDLSLPRSKLRFAEFIIDQKKSLTQSNESVDLFAPFITVDRTKKPISLPCKLCKRTFHTHFSYDDHFNSEEHIQNSSNTNIRYQEPNNNLQLVLALINSQQP